MWIMSEEGFIHSGRIVAVRPPIKPTDKTLRVTYEGRDIRIMRAEAEKLIGPRETSIADEAALLHFALAKDDMVREEEARLHNLEREREDV